MVLQLKLGKVLTRVLTIAFVLLPLLTGAGLAQGAPGAVLEPVEDIKLDLLLKRHFSLPLFLDGFSSSGSDRDQAISSEAKKLETLMKAQGYLAATIEIRESQLPGEPLVMRPVPGPLFRLGWVRVDDLPPEPDKSLETSLNSVLDRYVGKHASRVEFADLRSAIRWVFREASFANAELSEPHLSLEPDTRTVGVVLSVDPGEQIHIGQVKFEGAANRRLEIAKELVPIRPGDPYKASVMDTVQQDLEQTGLFRRVRISLADRPNRSGQYDLNIEVRDGPSDPVQLKESSGLGPFLLLSTIFLIVFRECVRVTRYWKNAAFRGSLTLLVFLMTATSGLFVVQRIAAFLS